MRLGAWLCVIAAGLGLPLGGCSGGYPLPPTRCDEWCHVTRGSYGYGFSCGYDFYSPASCVSQCEAEELGNENCVAQFSVALECYRTAPKPSLSSCYDPLYMPPCQTEALLLIECAAPYVENRYGFTPAPSSPAPDDVPPQGDPPVQE